MPWKIAQKIVGYGGPQSPDIVVAEQAATSVTNSRNARTASNDSLIVRASLAVAGAQAVYGLPRRRIAASLSSKDW